jgi:hypothetical protein
MVAQNRLLDALAPYDRIVVLCGRDNFNLSKETSDFRESLKLARSEHPQILGQDHYGCVVLKSEEGGIENGVFHTTSRDPFVWWLRATMFIDGYSVERCHFALWSAVIN